MIPVGVGSEDGGVDVQTACHTAHSRPSIWSLSFIGTMASPAHRPADDDRICYGDWIRPAPTLSALAENELQPRRGEEPNDDAVCRKGHGPARETAGRPMNPPRQ